MSLGWLHPLPKLRPGFSISLLPLRTASAKTPRTRQSPTLALAVCLTSAVCASSRGQKPVYFEYPQVSGTTASLQWRQLPPWMSMGFELRGRLEGQTSYQQVSTNERIYELTRVRGAVELRPARFVTGYLQ